LRAVVKDNGTGVQCNRPLFPFLPFLPFFPLPRSRAHARSLSHFPSLAARYPSLPLLFICAIFSFHSLLCHMRSIACRRLLRFLFPLSIDPLPFRLCSSLASATRPFPVCATQGQHPPFSLSHACMRALVFICVHEHSLTCHCIISSALVRSLCALRKPYTRHSLPLSSIRRRFLESTVRLSYSGFGSTSRSP
jgi:hypothetical protein